MLVTKIVERDMGHRVPNHRSKCRNLHGHRYRAEITMRGDIVDIEGVSEEGMVIDFTDIKMIAKTFIDEKLDHGYMCMVGDEIGKLVEKMGLKIERVPFVPTAENISKYLFEKLGPQYHDTYGTDLELYSIKLYETPNSYVLACIE